MTSLAEGHLPLARDKFSDEIHMSIGSIYDLRYDQGSFSAVTSDEASRADNVYINRETGQAWYLEQKWGGKTSFPFSKLRKDQEDWLMERKGFSFVSITIGLKPDLRKKEHPYARRTWIIPIQKYCEVSRVRSKSKKSMNIKDMENAFSEYEVAWYPDKHELNVTDWRFENVKNT